MTFSKTLKTLFLTLLITIAMFFSQSPMVLAAASASGALENLKNLSTTPTDASSNVSSILSNNTFTGTSGTTSTAIYEPTSWTLGSSENLKNIKYGVIDLSQLDKNAKNYGLESNQPLLTMADEEEVLMFNSTSESAGSSINYYQSITLEANSFYRISVNAFTSNEAFASIYLDNENFDKTASKMDSINTSKNWNTYYFFIATSPYASQTVDVNLYLGNKTTPSTGYALFDNITIMRYSENKFNALTQLLPANTNLIDQRVTSITVPTENGYVDTNFDNWTLEGSNGESYVERVATNYTGSNGNLKNIHPGTNFSSQTQAGLAFSATSGNINYKSPDIKIGRNELYKISFYAKGNVQSGSINAVLSGTIPNTPADEDDTEQSASITTNPSNASNFDNSWSLYSFYVKGSSLYDTTVNLVLGLGTSSASANGYIIYAYINSYKLTQEEYSDGQSIGTTTTLNMTQSASLSFTNSAFNDFTASDDPTYPAQPTGWTYEVGDKTASVVNGVVNTKASSFATYTSLSSDIACPQTKYGDYSNNALVLYNNTPTYQGYFADESYTISDGTYYLATLDVFLQRDLLSDTTSGAYIYFRDASGSNIAWFRYDAKNTTNSWQTLKVYLHGSFEARTLTPYLFLGSEDKPTSGVVFFDNCKIAESTAEAFEAAVAGDFVKKVDLGTDSFKLYDSVKNKIYAPSLWTLSSGDASINTSKLGLIQNHDLPNFLTKSPINDINEDTNMLMIGTTVEQNYTYTNKLSYSLEAENYYKFTIDVKTLMLAHTFDPETEDAKTPYGVNITLEGLENAVATNINTQKVETTYTNLQDALNEQENIFVTYTFFLYPTEASNVIVKLALGNEQQLCSGYAFFKNISIEKIDKDSYETEIAILTNNNKTALPESIIDLVNVEDDEEEQGGESYKNNNDWWASVFTIIIALAVLVAVIGFVIKRVNENKKDSVHVSNNYDRLETLLKDVDRRNKTTEINTKIRNLQEELKQSQKFLEEERESLEKEKSQFETAKEIANDTGIAIESPKKKLDKMQKSVEELEQKITEIELDIQVLEEEKERINKQEKKAIENSKKIKIKTRK